VFEDTRGGCDIGVKKDLIVIIKEEKVVGESGKED